MADEQDNQIERRDSGGISRRSETARRGSDAASFVRGLANRRTGSDTPSIVPTGHTYEFVLKWGTKGTGEGEFAGPAGVAVASDGSVYIADTGNDRIQKFTSEGVFVTNLGTYGTSEAEFRGPSGVAVASDGSIYVADYGNNRIQKFNSEGIFVIRSWFDPANKRSENFDYGGPWGITVTSEGSVFVCEVDAFHRVQKFTSEGEFVIQWGRQGAGDGEFNCPSGISVASDGSVYVADSGNARIQKFTPGGVFVCKWGTEGAGDGQFDEPNGVAVAPDGSVYVSDGNNHRIQKFLPVQ